MPHSQLTPLEPLGVGTTDCESLGSYVQRIAAAHGTYPGQLVFRLLTWLKRKEPQRIGGWTPRLRKLWLGRNINSFGHADEWQAVLHRATGRVDLGALTTRAWDPLFPTRNFQSNALARCPLCLSEDRVPYHRLAWSLQAVRCCRKHKISLRRTCPECERTVPVIHDRSRITICPWCASDLARSPTQDTVARDSFDFWCAEQVGEILTHQFGETTWRAQCAFKVLGESRGLKTVTSFADFIGAAKLTAWYWLTGRARPTLMSALRVYHRFGVSLAAHLFAEDPERLQSIVGVSQHELRLRPKRGRRKIDWKPVRSRLFEELKRPIDSAPKFIEVSARLGIARRTLRAHEPELCRLLAARWKERRRRDIQDRHALLKRTIKTALREIAMFGQGPSQKRIETVLKRPGLFNRRYARAAQRELFREIVGSSP